MENYEQIFEEEYYENRKENRDYIVRVTLCQLILCAVFVGGIFCVCEASEQVKMKFTESLEYLQRGDFTEEIQAVKGLFDFDVQI